jgi:transcriptional regulator with XRE-family HTH domain
VIKRRLSELGISAIEFRTRVGLSLEVLDKRPPLATISADVVARICEVLDVELAQLLGRQRPDKAPCPDDDDLVVEAALARHGQLSDHDLATALDWPLTRVDMATRALALRLLGTALQLVRVGNRVHLEPRPDLLGAEAEARLHAAEQAQIPLSAQEAVVALQLLHQRHDAVQQPLAVDAETIEVLLYRRLAEQDETGLQPHADLSFGMALRSVPDLPKRWRAKPPGSSDKRSRP